MASQRGKEKKPRNKAEEAKLPSLSYRFCCRSVLIQQRGRVISSNIIHVSSSRFVQRGYDGYSMVISIFG